MKRRNFLKNTALASAAIAGSSYSEVANALVLSTSNENKLTPPKTGRIPVAFLISQGATMIDYAGPWEVFQDVHVPSRGSDHADQMPFELFTVSDTTEIVVGSAGLKIVPNYNFANAPSPKVVVIPAQGGRSQSMFEWLSKVSQTADVIMSVCTGASFWLKQVCFPAGLRPLTTILSIASRRSIRIFRSNVAFVLSKVRRSPPPAGSLRGSI